MSTASTQDKPLENWNWFRATYRMLRIAVFLFGLLLASMALLQLISPQSIDSADGSSPLWKAQIRGLVMLTYASFMLLPHRWFTTNRFWFIVALGILSLGGLWMLKTSAVGVLDYFRGGRHWGILPTSAIFMILAVTAPVTLLMKTRLLDLRD
jgi:hypothetical protein